MIADGTTAQEFQPCSTTAAECEAGSTLMKPKKFEDYALPAGKIHSAPLYSQLSTVFRDLICSETWPKGVALPSEAELARRYGVSVGTTRKALDALEDCGWITRKQGRGTYVSDPAVEQFDRFCRIFSTTNGENLFSQLSAANLNTALLPVEPRDVQLLQLPEPSAAFRILRRFTRNAGPVMVESQLLRGDVFPGLDKRDDLPINLYGVFLRDYSVVVHRGTEHVSAVAASEELSSLLNVEANAPLLHTKSVVEDLEGRTVGVIQRWLQTSGVEYVAVLT
jgi:GntR family transcriptional regulator